MTDFSNFVTPPVAEAAEAVAAPPPAVEAEEVALPEAETTGAVAPAEDEVDEKPEPFTKVVESELLVPDPYPEPDTESAEIVEQEEPSEMAAAQSAVADSIMAPEAFEDAFGIKISAEGKLLDG